MNDGPNDGLTLVDAFVQPRRLGWAGTVRDGVMPGQYACRHVFQNSTPAGFETVVAWIESGHLATMRLPKVVRQGSITVVALLYELAVGPTQLESRINACRDASAFEYRVCAIGSDEAHHLNLVFDAAVNQVIGAQLAGKIQSGGMDIDGQHHTPAVAACVDYTQPDQSAAVNDQGVIRVWIGHVDPMEPHGRHDEHTGNIVVDPLRQQGEAVILYRIHDDVRAVSAGENRDVGAVRQLHRGIVTVIDLVAVCEPRDFTAHLLNDTDTLIPGAERIGASVLGWAASPLPEKSSGLYK